MLRTVAHWIGAGLLVGVASLPALAAAQELSAIVEAVSPPREDVRAFDILMDGTVIELKPGEMLSLGYMNSCAHEEISGGTVTVGAKESKVEGGNVTRTVVSCNGSVDPDSAAGANEAAVVAIRSLGDDDPSVRVVESLEPVFVLDEGGMPSDPSLVIQRLDQTEAPIRVSLFGRTLDLKQTGMKLTQGGVYSAICGDRKAAFKIAPNAGVAPVVMLQRVVRL
ncbi:MAG TPA: hypothetical protein VJV39_25540 [Dongiaceae bacterium]|nr:hypothetical protein [Dongiaceae bacterium]